MKRCGKILFVVLLVMLLIATLVACNPTGQGGGDGGSGSNTDGGDKVIGIVGLQIDATNTDCYLGEFNLGRDVKAYLLEKRSISFEKHRNLLHIQNYAKRSIVALCV